MWALFINMESPVWVWGQKFKVWCLGSKVYVFGTAWSTCLGFGTSYVWCKEESGNQNRPHDAHDAGSWGSAGTSTCALSLKVRAAGSVCGCEYKRWLPTADSSLKQNATTILWNASAYSSCPPDTARNTKAHRSRSTLRPKRKQQQVSVCLDPPVITTYHGRSTHP